MWLRANMQSESSSCISGVCVLFVYLVFTKGTHYITKVTTVCLNGLVLWCGESDMPSFGCWLSFFISFFKWQMHFLKPFRNISLVWVASIALIFFGISVWFFCLPGYAGTGASPAPCSAASSGPEHTGLAVGNILLVSLAFGTLVGIFGFWD